MQKRKHTKGIVFHHSLSGDVTAETITEWHKERGFETIGYHFVIRENGKIEKGRGQEYIGAHMKGHNYHTIGICLVGNFDKHYPTIDQYDSAVWLFSDLNRQYGHHLELLYHRHKNNACPGKMLDRGFLKAMLKKAGNSL